jgi:hypothetical protein
VIIKNLHKLEDDQIYEYFNFKSTIRNWNDFCQPKFSKQTFNEIKMIDVDQNAHASYLKGYEFLNSENFKHIYLDEYEDNFRKFLEECERLETINLNVNFNSFWGGVSNKFMESVYQEVPKVMTVIQGNDFHSSFYKDDNTLNEEKMCNYLWFFSDLYANQRTCLFLPILHKQNPSVVKQLFNINSDVDSDEIYKYYYSSLCGANLHNFYIPSRSLSYGSSMNIQNLIHNNYVNFYETDTIFATDIQHKVNIDNKAHSQDGVLFNFSRNIIDKQFNWKMLFTNAYKFNQYNSSVIHGFNEKNMILNEKVDGFLKKHSGFNYTSPDKIEIPLCFPRKVYVDGKEIFLSNLNIACNYRPFPDYPLKYINNIPKYLKENDIKVRKYLNTFDVGKYIESKDKIEELYSLFDSYEKFNDGDAVEDDEDLSD